MASLERAQSLHAHEIPEAELAPTRYRILQISPMLNSTSPLPREISFFVFLHVHPPPLSVSTLYPPPLPGPRV